MSYRPSKIVSGAQTGVDRAALDAALEAGLPCGGWVPKGRLAEDGRVPDKYPVQELDTEEYAVRTERNVLESDATLILVHGPLTGGTKLTFQFCRTFRKPVVVVSLDDRTAEAAIRLFLEREKPAVLNVAGPRESGAPGIQAAALDLLRHALSPSAPRG